MNLRQSHAMILFIGALCLVDAFTTAADPATVVGAWHAKDEAAGAQASLELTAEGRYVWIEQAANGASRTIKGVYEVRNNALILKADGAAQAGTLPFRLIDADTLAVQGPAGVLRMQRKPADAKPALDKKTAPDPARKIAVKSPGGFILHRCMDEQGFKDEFGKPLECFRILVPRGWTIEGGVTWIAARKDPRLMQEADFQRPAIVAFTLNAPKNRVALQAYPGLQLVNLGNSPVAQTGMFPPGSNYAGMTVSPLMGPADYILNVVVRQRGAMKNARVIEKKDLPEVAKRFDAEEKLYAHALQLVGAAVQHSAAMVTIEYDLDGVLYREAFVTDIGYLHAGAIVMFSPVFAVSSRAPADEFDAWQPYILCSLYSFKLNPLWGAMYRLTVAKANAKIDEVRNHCAKIDAEIAANRAKTNSQINNEFYRDVLAPYKGYKAPDGTEHFLPNNEKHQTDRQGNIYSGENVKEGDADRIDLK